MNARLPINATTLGAPPKTIIVFQSVCMRLFLMKKCPNKRAYIFPKVIDKLKRIKLFPRYFVGMIYKSNVVVMELVKPKANPYINLRMKREVILLAK